jgi:hypothetical protein
MGSRNACALPMATLVLAFPQAHLFPVVFGIGCHGGRDDRCDRAPMQRRGDGESQHLVRADWAEGYLCEEQQIVGRVGLPNRALRTHDIQTGQARSKYS